jgi:hypothetical protein
MLYGTHKIFLDSFHRPVFHLHLRPETDPVSETSCFLEYRTGEKVQKNAVSSVHRTDEFHTTQSKKKIIIIIIIITINIISDLFIYTFS